MQWLIDLVAERVIDTIGIPPVYIDRGDYADSDFDETTLTLDNTWRDLDLSGIIDEGASAVVMMIQIRATVIGNFIQMRKKGVAAENFTIVIRSQIANLRINQNPVIGVDENRILQYKIAGPNWTAIDVVVRGWWL